jgi:hypothetical protein
MEIKITSNIKQVMKSLDRMQKRQVPYAASVAINETLKDVVRAEQKQLPMKLDRPTPQTVKALRVLKYAKKTSLSGRVGFLDWAQPYMSLQVYGGSRPGKTTVPVDPARINQYGNVKGRRSGLKKRQKDFFVKGTGMFTRYGRGGKQVKLVHATIDNPQYRKRFPFYEIAGGVVNSKFDRNFVKALQKALRTAR